MYFGGQRIAFGLRTFQNIAEEIRWNAKHRYKVRHFLIECGFSVNKMVYRPKHIRTNFQMGEMPVENIIYSRWVMHNFGRFGTSMTWVFFHVVESWEQNSLLLEAQSLSNRNKTHCMWTWPYSRTTVLSNYGRYGKIWENYSLSSCLMSCLIQFPATQTFKQVLTQKCGDFFIFIEKQICISILAVSQKK